MASCREEKIRNRAYEIWQREGSPDGRCDEHWSQATRDIENEERAGSGVSRGIRATANQDPTRGSAPSGGASGFSGAQSGGSSGSGGAGMSGSRSGAAGASGTASGLQPGGAKPADGPAVTEGSPGTGRGKHG
jgi:Protein of unknown function (DUF2934)